MRGLSKPTCAEIGDRLTTENMSSTIRHMFPVRSDQDDEDEFDSVPDLILAADRPIRATTCPRCEMPKPNRHAGCSNCWAQQEVAKKHERRR